MTAEQPRYSADTKKEQTGLTERTERTERTGALIHGSEGVGACINIHVLEERLKALQDRLLAVETAFPRTSVGTPAFDKHRDYHEEEDLKQTRVKQIQHEITKKIIVVVFGALLSTLLSGYLDDITRFVASFQTVIQREQREQKEQKVDSKEK